MLGVGVLAYRDDLAVADGEDARGGTAIRTVPLVDPTPLYAWSLIWRRDDHHPRLPELLQAAQPACHAQGTFGTFQPLMVPFVYGAEHQGSRDRTPGGRGRGIDGNDEDRSRPVRPAPGPPSAVRSVGPAAGGTSHPVPRGGNLAADAAGPDWQAGVQSGTRGDPRFRRARRMIIDSSAILAVIGKEPGYERIIHELAASPGTRIGAPTRLETGIVLTARFGSRGSRCCAPETTLPGPIWSWPASIPMRRRLTRKVPTSPCAELPVGC